MPYCTLPFVIELKLEAMPATATGPFANFVVLFFIFAKLRGGKISLRSLESAYHTQTQNGTRTAKAKRLTLPGDIKNALRTDMERNQLNSQKPYVRAVPSGKRRKSLLQVHQTQVRRGGERARYLWGLAPPKV